MTCFCHYSIIQNCLSALIIISTLPMPTSLPILKEKDQSGEERGSADKKCQSQEESAPVWRTCLDSYFI